MRTIGRLLASALTGLALTSTVIVATSVAATPAFAGTIHSTPCANNGAPKTVTRAYTLERAASWIGVTPYSQTHCYTNGYGDYRTDCSGMVSMAWGLGNVGNYYYTGNIDDVSYHISASDLQPGDALLSPNPGSSDAHLALFEGWANTAHTSVKVIQETGSAGNTIEGVPTNFTWTSYTPIRYNNMADGKANVISKPDDTLEAFVLGTDGAIWLAGQSGSTGWTTFTSLGGSLLGDPAAGVNADGRMEVFARGADGKLQHAYQTSPGGSWSGFSDLGGTMLGDPAVGIDTDGRLEVFYRTTANAINHMYQLQPSQPFTGPGDIGGGTVISDPTVIRNRNGNLEVFATQTNHTLGHAWWDGSVWSGFYTLGGSVSGTPTAEMNTDGRVEVFARGTDGAIWHTYQLVANGTTGWLPAPITMGGQVTSDPVVTVNSDGRLEVFAVGFDRTLTHNWQLTAGGSWSGSASLGGIITSTPTVALYSNGRNVVLTRGTDNGLYRNTQTSTGWDPIAAVTSNFSH
jgi:hypothetical protein